LMTWGKILTFSGFISSSSSSGYTFLSFSPQQDEIIVPNPGRIILKKSKTDAKHMLFTGMRPSVQHQGCSSSFYSWCILNFLLPLTVSSSKWAYYEFSSNVLTISRASGAFSDI
jgi:hypothetical protein